MPLSYTGENIAEAQGQTVQTFSLKEKAGGVSDLLKSLKLPDVEEKIRRSAIRYGVDVSLALNIACAESHFRPASKNPKSTAEGVYQWLNGSWAYYGNRYWGSLEGKSKLDADDNIALAMLVLRDRGTIDWEASRNEGFGGGWANKPYDKKLCPIE